MSAISTIDLTKNPDVAALVADMQPGQKVYACFTIKDRDDQTLNIRLKEMAATCDELKDSDSEDDEEDDSDDQSPEGEEAEAPEPAEPPMRSAARRIASNEQSGY